MPVKEWVKNNSLMRLAVQYGYSYSSLRFVLILLLFLACSRRRKLLPIEHGSFIYLI